MRRILVSLIVLAGIGGFVLLTGAAKEDEQKKPSYWLELDNAFGLTPGSDFKIAGVRAGKITEMKVDRRSKRALIGFEVNAPGNFAPIKTDVFCQSRPQSLIGEYFIDCNPGRNATALKPGSTIPVTQSFSTIGADLVNNILRLPQRQRLRIILNELGTGVGARGEDINEVVRRAVPALRETDRLLALLANENQTLVNLTVNADRVVGELAANRGEITRFVREARDTSAASADRRVALRESFRRLPAFLRQLRPTMVSLGQVADEQIPTLRDLDAASGNLRAFLNQLGPFSEASRPALSSLGQTGVAGQQAIPPIHRTVRHLRELTPNVPELGKNLRIVLEDLYDRDRAVEPDPRSPGGKGFNGFEAILMYTFWQTQAINIFDKNSYILKVAVLELSGEGCSEYHNQSVKDEPEIIHDCASWLGPDQPGITTPDPTSPQTAPGGQSLNARSSDEEQQEAARRSVAAAEVLQGAKAAAGSASQSGAAGAPAGGNPTGQAIDIPRSLRALTGGGSAGSQSPAPSADGAAPLLDYLLAR